jgi:hypothetical protein
MKNPILFLSAILILTACGQDFRGKGPVTTEKREVESFDRIQCESVVTVTLVQDSVSYVAVSTYQNLLPQITTSVENGALKISMKKGFLNLNTPDAEVEVHALRLKEISLDGVGSLAVRDSFHFNEVELRIRGVGSMKLAGTARLARMSNEGTGSIDATSLIADSVFAETRGVGSIDCFASKYLDARVQGIGSISYGGDPVATTSVEGIGRISKKEK